MREPVDLIGVGGGVAEVALAKEVPRTKGVRGRSTKESLTGLVLKQ
jgi:hypothetical protein